jgi:hypothetical protein
MGMKDIEWTPKQRRETDIVKQATVDKIYVTTGIRTINEVRENLGEDPLPFPEANEPGVLTPNGFIPLTAGIVNQPGAQGSGKGPAAKEMLSNLEDHKNEQQQQQQAQGELSHQRAVELQQAKAGGPEQVPPVKGEAQPTGLGTPTPGKQKDNRAQTPQERNVRGKTKKCEEHGEHPDPVGCFQCFAAELDRVQESFARAEPERGSTLPFLAPEPKPNGNGHKPQKAHCVRHAAFDSDCFDCGHAQLARAQMRELLQRCLPLRY